MFKRVALAVMIAAQLAVPCAMIYSMENILKHGEVWRFKTAPVDPYDIFRGRYVALAVEESKIDYQGGEKFFPGQKVYVTLLKDGQGFARLKEISSKKPDAESFLKVTVNYHETLRHVLVPAAQTAAAAQTPAEYRQEKVNTVHLRLPFDRYYMNEKKAPEAELQYQQRHADGQMKNAYIDARVLGGQALIEGLYLDGKPIEEAARADGK